MQPYSTSALVAVPSDPPARRSRRVSRRLTAALVDRPHVDSTLAGAIVGGLVSFSIAYFCR